MAQVCVRSEGLRCEFPGAPLVVLHCGVFLSGGSRGFGSELCALRLYLVLKDCVQLPYKLLAPYLGFVWGCSPTTKKH